MKLIFFLRNGVVEWPVPDSDRPVFNFSGIVTTIRVNGFFLGTNIYIRHEELVGMAFSDDIAPSAEFKATVQGTLQ